MSLAYQANHKAIVSLQKQLDAMKNALLLQAREIDELKRQVAGL